MENNSKVNIVIKTPEEYFKNPDDLKLFLAKPKTLNDEEKKLRDKLKVAYANYKYYCDPLVKQKNKLNSKMRYHENDTYREKKKQQSLIISKKRYLIKNDEIKQMKQELEQLRSKLKDSDN